MTSSAPVGFTAERDQFIPVRKADLLDALIEHGPLGSEAKRAEFRQICRVLAAIYHYQYFEQLERLRHDYFYFDPELDPHAHFDNAALEAAYADLIGSLTTVLKRANFVEMSHAEIEEAHRQRKAMRVQVAVSLDDFREARFFYRGQRQETIQTQRWLGLRTDSHEVTVHDDVILFVATKPADDIASQREKKLLARRRIRSGSVLIKYFRNVADTDLNALFPNVRVVMSLLDSLTLGLPAIVGAIPILINLASTVLKRAFAAMSGVAALIGFVMRQWLRYQRQSLRYQKELTDNVYFRNVNNNAGVFDYMIGAAEEQECKEAFWPIISCAQQSRH